MGLGLIQCGRPTVKVIPPDGQVRQFDLPLSVADLLLRYPHHYVRQAKGSILSTDAELEGGHTYLLLPLPKLFPRPSPTTLPSCSCRPTKPPSSKLSPHGLCVATSRHSSRGTRRGRLWEPSLDIISENNMLPHTKSEQPVTKKRDERMAPRVCTWKQNPRDMQTAISLSAVVPSGFIF